MASSASSTSSPGKSKALGVDDKNQDAFNKLKNAKDKINMVQDLLRSNKQHTNIFENLGKNLNIDAYLNKENGNFADAYNKIDAFQKNPDPNEAITFANLKDYDESNNDITCTADSETKIKQIFQRYSNISYLYVVKHKELQNALTLIKHLAKYKDNILGKYIEIIQLLYEFDNNGQLTPATKDFKLPKHFIKDVDNILKQQFEASKQVKDFTDSVINDTAGFNTYKNDTPPRASSSLPPPALPAAPASPPPGAPTTQSGGSKSSSHKLTKKRKLVTKSKRTQRKGLKRKNTKKNNKH